MNGASPRVVPTVVLITPEGVEAAPLWRVVEAGAAALGASLVVQARAKAGEVEARRVATLVAEVARACEVPFVVNGSVELTRSLGADGLHAPSAMPARGLRVALGELWLSRAAHTGDDVREAARAGLDAVLVSPIYAVPGKAPARGLEALSEARLLAARATPHNRQLRVIALGGITPERAAACIRAGAHGVAIMRAAFREPSPRRLFEDLCAALRDAPARGDARATPMPTYDDTLKATIELLRRHVGPSKVVSPSDDIMNDLGLDSLAVMELIADAEDRFDVSISSETLAAIATVDDVAKAVAKLSQPA